MHHPLSNNSQPTRTSRSCRPTFTGSRPRRGFPFRTARLPLCFRCAGGPPPHGVVGRRGGDAGASEHSGVLHELQDGPGFAVLAGLERPELAAALSPAALVEAVAVLRQRFAYVLVDAGSYGDAANTAVQEA